MELGSPALLGAVGTMPAIVLMPFDVSSGLTLRVSASLLATIIGVAPVRRARAQVVVLSLLMGVPIFVGSLLSEEPTLAVVSILVLAVGAAMLSTRPPLGPFLMTISLPMIGEHRVQLRRPRRGLRVGAADIVGAAYAVARVAALAGAGDAAGAARSTGAVAAVDDRVSMEGGA